MKKVLLPNIIILLLFPAVVFSVQVPDDAQKTIIQEKLNQMQVPFIENRGQIENNNVLFYANTFAGPVSIEKSGVLTYNHLFTDKTGLVISEVLTQKGVSARGMDVSPARVNHFKGRDKKKWKNDLQSYESVSLGEVYRGIELTLRAYGNTVEKLFTVLSQGDPGIIRIRIEGAKRLQVNETGELEIVAEMGSVKFAKPIAYQDVDGEKKPVEIAYAIYRDTMYGFMVGSYDKKTTLTLFMNTLSAPLQASTFIGGSDEDWGSAMAVDGSGNVYVTGYTRSPDFSTTDGAYEKKRPVYRDVFVSKLDSNLSTLQASTFIGGSDEDWGSAMAVDGSGNVYVTGYTRSPDFPTTDGAYHKNYTGGESDVFVSKFDSNLSTLLASTFIGGSHGEKGYGTVLDESGNVYVAGYTRSPDFPATDGAYDRNYTGGDGDVFVSKFDSSLSTLLASTFIGGSGFEYGAAIALDKNRNVYFTGYTSSKDYPTTSDVYNQSYTGGDGDVFVSKFDGNLSTLLASTFIGGSDWDQGYGIVLDESGNVYLAGSTYSSNFPVTDRAYDQSFNGFRDVFISKLDSSLSTLLASTFIGGGIWEDGYSIALDEKGDVYITGSSTSEDYPVAPGSHAKCVFSGNDVFVSKLDSNLRSLLASTFICGGNQGLDQGYSIKVNKEGAIYVAGVAGTTQFPTTEGAYDRSYGGKYDVFVSKLYFPSNTNALCPATAIYGEDSEEAALLRSFRDNVLSRTRKGREIIRLYYQWSPGIVKSMKENEDFRKRVKKILDGILPLIRSDRAVVDN